MRKFFNDLEYLVFRITVLASFVISAWKLIANHLK
jgi:hypothetical protein